MRHATTALATPRESSAASTPTRTGYTRHGSQERLVPGRPLGGGLAADGRVAATAGAGVAVSRCTSTESQRQLPPRPPGLHRLQCRPRPAGPPFLHPRDQAGVASARPVLRLPKGPPGTAMWYAAT